MLIVICLALWAFSLFYGISLIRTDRRKLGIRYLIIFSIPLAIIIIGVWWMDYEYVNCMLNAASETMENC
jgi:hypothetical protein